MISELWTFQTYEHPHSEGFVTLRFYCIVNQLVSAGLISPDLMDILVDPGNDAVVMKKWTKRITGERDLTAGEYADMLREDKWRKEKIEKQKQKRTAERERNKKEREEQQKAGKGRGCGITKENIFFVIVGDFSLSFLKAIQVLILMLVNGPGPSSSRPSHCRQIPSCYRRDSSALCSICQNNEPEGLASSVVFGSTVMTVEAGYTMCVPLE